MDFNNIISVWISPPPCETHPALLGGQQGEQRAAVHLPHQQLRHTGEEHNTDAFRLRNTTHGKITRSQEVTEKMAD